MRVKDLEQTFICGHRASAGGLLTSLLDFHPELLVVPHESKFFQLYYPFMDSDSFSDEEKVQSISANIIEYMKSVLVESVKVKKDYFDVHIFTKKFKEYAVGNNNWGDYLISVMKAYAYTSPQEKDNLKRWVERSTISEIYASEIIRRFPKAKFIQVVRDPRDNYASMKSRWNNKLRFLSDSSSIESLMQSFIDRARLCLEAGIVNKKIYNNQYMLCRCEDLIVDPKKTLSEIANFLEINNDLFDYRTTFCGLLWGGNNFDGKKFDGISSSQIGLWKERIEEDEAALVEFHFRHVMKYYGYKTEYNEQMQMESASKHYKWFNFVSDRKADFKLANKY